mgnify:CR=1 FL=1
MTTFSENNVIQKLWLDFYNCIYIISYNCKKETSQLSNYVADYRIILPDFLMENCKIIIVHKY